MILRCVDGPLDGENYVVDGELPPYVESNSKKMPDGLWFNGQDDRERNVQHQYAFERLVEAGGHVFMLYRYSGPVVETGIELETEGP